MESQAAGTGWREVRYRHSGSLVDVLRAMRCALLVSTYQAGKLISIGRAEDSLQLTFHTFDRAMGVAANRGTIAVGSRREVWFLKDNSRLAACMEPAGRYDRCYLPRSTTVTGPIQCHELAWGTVDGATTELWVVNTLFSCLATLHPDYSFVPRWRPPFVSRLAAEDRCHLNGVGMRDGRPSVVTVLARTDEAGAWRAEKTRTGCVLDVASGEPVTEGLAMPHSPRWHGGRLLVANSGQGTLEAVDVETGGRTPIDAVPGFARGLACHGNLAFVGLSKIRETAVFGGVPIAARHAELKCGVGVIDLVTGTTVATLEFESGVEEIFDVQVLPDSRCVALTGGGMGADPDVWVVPPESDGALRPGPAAPTSVTPADIQVASALAAQRAGRPAEAVAILRRAAAMHPHEAALANHLGNALQEAGDQKAALRAYRQALTADPTFVPALQNLGYLLLGRGETDEGVRWLGRAQDQRPSALTRVMIATALPVVYDSAEHVATARARIEREVQALVDDGVRIDTTGTLVPTTFFAAYQGFDDRNLQANLGRIHHGPDLTRIPRTGRRRSSGRARIGLLSAYFRDHTIGRLNLGRVERLSREHLEVVVLSASAARDPIAAAFEAAADDFVAVPRDVAAARRIIAGHELDLLLFADVGMDALTSTLAFSRMAPVQCVTWGHPVTTGSPTMDHFVTSDLLEVAGAEAHYTERLARLATLGTYYHRPRRPSLDDARGRLGLPEGTLYGCPQTLFKLHPDFDEVLGRVLRGDPSGWLVLIEGRVAPWTDRLKARFERSIADVAHRIRWLPPLPHEDFLRLLAVADVVLDPIHFGGGNSSYEALAMGTPVVTLPGEFLRSRITRALYQKAGFTDLVAASVDDFVQTAVRLGTDAGHRDTVQRLLSDACSVLFEDDEEIRDLEEFLLGVLAD